MSMTDDDLKSLRWACQNGDEDKKIEKYLQDGGDPDKTIEGRNLLHIAADYGQKGVLEQLIAKKADIDAKDRFQVSALLAAIYEGHKECVEFLLKNGASKDGTAPDGSPYIECTDRDDIKELLK